MATMYALMGEKCPIRVLTAVMKHHVKKQAGEKIVYLAYTSISLLIIGGSQDRSSSRTRIWRQELM